MLDGSGHFTYGVCCRLQPSDKWLQNQRSDTEGYVKEDRSRQPVDWSEAQVGVFPNLKPTSTPISLRLPIAVLARLKVKAHRRGLPCQSCMKEVLARDVER